MNTPRILLTSCVFLLLLSNVVYSQIAISSDDFLGLIGQSQEIEIDTTGSVTINVGSAGANQMWDFRFNIDSPLKFTQEFIEPAGTPFQSDFPQSNFVEKFSQFSMGFEGNIFAYYEVTSSSFSTLGEGFVISSPVDTAFIISQAEDIAPLPQTLWLITSFLYTKNGRYKIIEEGSHVHSQQRQGHNANDGNKEENQTVFE